VTPLGKRPAFDGERIARVLGWLGILAFVAGVMFFEKYVVSQFLK